MEKKKKEEEEEKSELKQHCKSNLSGPFIRYKFRTRHINQKLYFSIYFESQNDAKQITT